MPDVSPLNYLFRHHLAINFADKSVHLQESLEDFRWKTIATHTKIGFEQCLEIAIPIVTGKQPRKKEWKLCQPSSKNQIGNFQQKIIHQ